MWTVLGASIIFAVVGGLCFKQRLMRLAGVIVFFGVGAIIGAIVASVLGLFVEQEWRVLEFGQIFLISGSSISGEGMDVEKPFVFLTIKDKKEGITSRVIHQNKKLNYSIIHQGEESFFSYEKLKTEPKHRDWVLAPTFTHYNFYIR